MYSSSRFFQARVVRPMHQRFPFSLYISFLLLFLLFPFHPFLLFSFPFIFPFSSRLASDVRMSSDRYYVQYIRGSLSWVASGIVGFSRRDY